MQIVRKDTAAQADVSRSPAAGVSFPLLGGAEAKRQACIEAHAKQALIPFSPIPPADDHGFTCRIGKSGVAQRLSQLARSAAVQITDFDAADAYGDGRAVKRLPRLWNQQGCAIEIVFVQTLFAAAAANARQRILVVRCPGNVKGKFAIAEQYATSDTAVARQPTQHVHRLFPAGKTILSTKYSANNHAGRWTNKPAVRLTHRPPRCPAVQYERGVFNFCRCDHYPTLPLKVRHKPAWRVAGNLRWHHPAASCRIRGGCGRARSRQS